MERFFKKLFPVLIVATFCLVYQPAAAQQLQRPKDNDSSIFKPSAVKALVDSGIDPRKYITVIYKRRPDTKTEKTLAVWRWDSYTEHQKYNVLDMDGVVEIYFDKEKLANDVKFKGSIGLEAIVKSKGGDRKIEITPYSLVGEKAQDYGTNAISPELTAQLLFNTIYTVKNVLHPPVPTFLSEDSLFNPLHSGTYIDTGDINLIIAEVSKRKGPVNGYDNLQNSIQAQALVNKLNSYTYKMYQESEELKRALFTSNYEAVGDRLASIKKSVITANENAIKETTQNAQELSASLKVILAYLEAFETSGIDAKSVFLRLIGTDIIKYTDIRETLSKNYKMLSDILGGKNVKSDIENGDLSNLIANTRKTLYDFSAITGSEFYQLVTSELQLKEESNYYYYGRGSSPAEFEVLKKLKSSDKFKTVLDHLSRIAGNYLYSLLTFGSIDLAKNDVKEGDKLYITVKWKNLRDYMVDSLKIKDEVSLPIGIYSIAKTGWSTKVSESFYLIERINEPGKTVDENVSPSNFKGAAGISLMRTYNYLEPNEGNNHRFLNWLQPSIGLNLSYVDFYTNKDLELGLGLQVGIFSNSVYLGYGVNLNGIRGGEKNATYFMLGLSFTNLAEKFKNKPVDEGK